MALEAIRKWDKKEEGRAVEGGKGIIEELKEEYGRVLAIEEVM